MTERDTACEDSATLVVVDLQQLEAGADPQAACADLERGANGVDALEAAGFDVTGSARFGRSFTCRIDDRPAAREDLELPGRGTYRETCTDTPPTAAYWSYWTATPGDCTWTYSPVGAASATPEAGGAQGWSFALGTPAGDAPAPRVEPCDATPSIHSTASRSAESSTDPGETHQRVDPVVALVLLLLFAIVAVVTARRRRAHRREDDDDA